MAASRRRLWASLHHLGLLLVLDVPDDRAETLVRHDVGLFDLPELVEDGVRHVRAIIPEPQEREQMEPFQQPALTKVALWVVTGADKTLIM